MTFIRYKKFGNQEYAYEVTSYWDSIQKKPRQKTRYLGTVINKEKKIYEKKKPEKKEKLILDFGDTYLLYEFLKKTKLRELIEKTFGKKTNYLLALLFYRLCYPSAMMHAKTWYEGNIARLMFKDINLSSQRISDFLKKIGDEHLQREFFKEYIQTFVKPEKGVIIDTTALPNQIHIPLNMWGYHDEEINKQIKLLLICDKETSLPLFFRYLPGNIADVSSLHMTVKELKKYGIGEYFILLDAGFFSENNIKGAYFEHLSFLIRLPSSRKLYKDLIRKETMDLERICNAVIYGKRGLFIKQKKVDLFGKKAYAHVVLDPERKGNETKKLLLKVMDDESLREEKETEFKLLKKGIMVLISSFEIKKDEVVPLYYMRQMIEKLFAFSKADLKLIPLRVHREETLRGFLFLLFLALIFFVFLKREIGKNYTVEEILLKMRNLKCKVFEEDVLVQEVGRGQKDILGELGIIVPKGAGV